MTEPLPTRSLSVSPDEVGERLDRFLAKHLPERSRSGLARLIEDGRVRVSGKVPTKAGQALRINDEIVVEELSGPVATGALAEAIPLDIVYQDEHIAVINKPAGLVVHPAPGHATGTLVNALLHWAREEDVTLDIDDEVRPGLVHRIDKDTSGLLVVAFNDPALRGLQTQFAKHVAERRYRAIVLGPRIADEGTIRTRYGRDPKDRKRYTGRHDASREAITHWRIVQRGKALALIELALETGRTHQIRVHMSESGHPIIADPIYGQTLPKNANGTFSTLANAELRAARVMPRLALHAAILGFVHPVTGAKMRFEAPDPEDFAGLIAALK